MEMMNFTPFLTLLLTFFISLTPIDYPFPPSRKKMRVLQTHCNLSKNRKKCIIDPGCFFFSILRPEDTLAEKLALVCCFGKVLPSQKEAL